jgi:hypothetical protein
LRPSVRRAAGFTHEKSAALSPPSGCLRRHYWAVVVQRGASRFSHAVTHALRERTTLQGIPARISRSSATRWIFSGFLRSDALESTARPPPVSRRNASNSARQVYRITLTGRRNRALASKSRRCHVDYHDKRPGIDVNAATPDGHHATRRIRTRGPSRVLRFST